MTLPATWNTVAVTGTFLNRDGTPASGWITFESQQVVTVGGKVVVPKTITAVLDGTGSISVDIPSTNDPELSVTGWAYTVTEHIADGRPPYLIEVPYSVSTLDLATAPHATSNPSLPVLTGIYATDVGVTVAAQAAVATAQATADNLKTDLANPVALKGSEMVAYLSTNAGAVGRTLADKLADQISIKDFGAVGDNVTDDTAAINAAYASVGENGATVFWPAGRYMTSASIVVKSNTTTVFDAAAIIDPVALAEFTQIEMPTYTFGYALFRNENFNTATTDTNITYLGVRMIPSRNDYSWYGGTGWSGHGIDSRNVQNLRISGCYGENLSDFSGTLNCNGVVIENNVAVAMSNSSYDFWEACQNVVVRNNVARGTNNGLNWNACDTENLGSATALNVLVEGNYFEGGLGSCIFVAPLNATASCRNVRIINNTLDQLNATGVGFSPHGINVQRTTGVLISGNVLFRIGVGEPAIIVGNDGTGPSSNATIVNNTILDSNASVYIYAYGANHFIAGNVATNSTASSGIVADSNTTVIGVNALIGATTEVTNQTNLGVPTTPALQLSFDKVNSRLYSRQSIMTGGDVLSVSDATSNNRFDVFSSSSSGSCPQFWARRGRGTQLSPAAVLANDRLMGITSSGQYDTTVGNFRQSASIGAFASENYSAAASGSYYDVEVTKTGTSARATHTRFSPMLNLLIGTTSEVHLGVGCIGLGNATTVPSVNPVNGGVLYVEAGALKYRGSSGTITTLGAA